MIDTATNRVVGAPIPVGDEPFAIAITPNGRTAYVASADIEHLTAIDTATNQPAAPIPVGGSPESLAISPDGTTAYVPLENSVAVVDLRTNQVSGPPIPVGQGPGQIAIAPDGKTAYVIALAARAVVVIDLQTRQVVGAPIQVGPSPSRLAVTPDGKTVLVADEDDGKVYAIDTQTRQVTTAQVPGADELIAIAIAPDGKRAYVVETEGDDLLYTIDIETRRVGPPVTVGDDSVELAITPDGRTIYVASFDINRVTAVDAQTNRVVDSIPVIGGPVAMAVVPNQSPIASFTTQPSKSTTGVRFRGSATDPDGAVSIFNWGFGDGTAALNAGATPSHSYKRGGKFTASLNVVDNEGCSTALVFTGRTAYCSGAPLAAQAVTVAPNRFRFGKLVRNAKKGTAKLRVKVPVGGRVTLSGKQLRRVKRSAGKAGTVVLPIKPKKKLRNALETQGSAKAKVRVTFRPTGGEAHAKTRPVRLALD